MAAERGCLGCTGIIGLVLILGWVGGALDSCGQASRQRAEERERGRAAVEAARQDSLQRIQDSITVLRIVTEASSSSKADWVAVDDVIHRRGFTIEHDRSHTRAVTILLDSAAGLLRPNRDGWGATAPAGSILSRLQPPLTPAQERKRTQLRGVINRQNKTIEVASRRAAERLLLDQRREYARRLETTYLDQGMDIRVRTRGARATTLRIEWILVNRVTAHQFSKESGIFSTLRQLGFKRLEITDGYDESWYWTLD